jgi:hypothetical protein
MSEEQDLIARIARMKQLVDELERTCSESATQRDTLAQLRREMDAARRDLKPAR